MTSMVIGSLLWFFCSLIIFLICQMMHTNISSFLSRTSVDIWVTFVPPSRKQQNCSNDIAMGNCLYLCQKVWLHNISTIYMKIWHMAFYDNLNQVTSISTDRDIVPTIRNWKTLEQFCWSLYGLMRPTSASMTAQGKFISLKQIWRPFAMTAPFPHSLNPTSELWFGGT